MANPFEDLGVSDADFEAEMEGPEVLRGRIALAEKAAAYWKTVSPVDSREYVESVRVTVRGNDVSVGSDDDKANIIEHGSEDTPEFAPRAKVQAKFRVSE